MFCPKCGLESRDISQLFCRKCGFKFALISAQTIIQDKLFFCPVCGKQSKNEGIYFCKQCRHQLNLRPIQQTKYGFCSNLAQINTLGALSATGIVFFFLFTVYAAWSSMTQEFNLPLEAIPVTQHQGTPISQVVSNSSKQNLEILDRSWTHNGANHMLFSGTLKNNASKTFQKIEIDVLLYNKANTNVGTFHLFAPSLEAGGTWQFMIPLDITNAENYKVTIYGM